MGVIQQLKQKNLKDYIESICGTMKTASTTGTYKYKKCPVCGGGGHFTVNTNDNLFNTWSHCAAGSIIDFHMAYYHVDKGTAIKELCSHFSLGNSTRNGSGAVKVKHPVKEKDLPKSQTVQEVKPVVEVDLTKCIEKYYMENDNNYAYFQMRLLNTQCNDMDILEKYCTEDIMDNLDKLISQNKFIVADPRKVFTKEHLPGLYNIHAYEYIMPIWQNGKVVNAVLRRNDSKSKQNQKAINLKGLGVKFFNAEYLKTEKTIFITEGIFDCLSFEVLGYKSICLNSVNMAGKLIEQVKQNIDTCKDTKFVLALDSDDAGSKARDKLNTGLKELGIDVLSLTVKEKDINDWYLADIDDLRNAIENTLNGVNKMDYKIAANGGIVSVVGSVATAACECLPPKVSEGVPPKIVPLNNNIIDMYKESFAALLNESPPEQFISNNDKNFKCEVINLNERQQEKQEDKGKSIINNDVFIKEVVSINPPGTGKTYSIADLVTEITQLNLNSELYIVSTMSNELIISIIREIVKVMGDKQIAEKEVLDDILTLKGHEKILFEKFGILIMNSLNQIHRDDLFKTKVIITNYAYDFPHGHTHGYNSNIRLIDEIVKATNKKVVRFYDEFDQYYRYGMETIDLNEFKGMNFEDKAKIQYCRVGHAFKYCREANIQKKASIEDSYLFKLPESCYKKTLKKDKEEIIRFFSNIYASKENTYDFKELVLDKLYNPSGIIEEETFGHKQHGLYLIETVVEIQRMKLTDEAVDEVKRRNELDTRNVEGQSNVIGNFLNTSSSIMLIESKIRVYDIEIDEEGKTVPGELLCRCNTREECIEFFKETCKLAGINEVDLEKESESQTDTPLSSWRSFRGSLTGHKKNPLYVKKIIVRKKQFKFDNQDNYYVTATPGCLKYMGHEIQYSGKKSPCGIEKLDIFVLPNKYAAINNAIYIFEELKHYPEIQAFAVVGKKEHIEKFVKENKTNEKLSNVQAVIEGRKINIGRPASDTKEDDKNTTATHQKSPEAQGTNYIPHNLMIQDTDIKISIEEMVFPQGENDFIIAERKELILENLEQSMARIWRGDKKYAAYFIYVNPDRIDDKGIEYKLEEHTAQRIKDNYGVEANMYYVKDMNGTKKEEKRTIIKSMLEHVSTRIDLYNEGNKNAKLYTYRNEELLKDEDGRVKFADKEKEIVDAYITWKLSGEKEKTAKAKVIEKFEISLRHFMNLKKKLADYIIDKMSERVEAVETEPEQYRYFDNEADLEHPSERLANDDYYFEE